MVYLILGVILLIVCLKYGGSLFVFLKDFFHS